MFHDRSLPFQIVGQKGGGGGGGGKKGGGSSGDTKNTIRSKARAQLVELICEGPIKGLVDGDKSIFFDETAIRNPNGSENFKNVEWEFHRGLPDDTYFRGSANAQTPHSVEAPVKANIGQVVRTINDDNADSVRIVVRVNSLYKVNDKDGKLEPTSLSYAIKYRNYNGQWVTAETVNINNQKTSSAYQKQHVVRLPAGGAPWDIAVERLTPDSDSDKLQNEMFFESYYTIVQGKFTYPNSAALFIGVNAEDQGSSIPARAVEIEGLIIKVPTNYNPETRTYSGLWDGSFKYAYSNNPAWVFYDLITNTRYGLGEFVDETKVDKWSLYQIAQYCDQEVDTGFTDINGVRTKEPRFVFNGVINSREEAFNVLKQIATNWRGMAFWSLGQVYAVADMPADPQKLVTPANVINGEFEYTGVALKAMHSVVLVSWNDPADFYRPAVEVVINDEMLKRYGWRDKSVTLMGCTSRGQAHRYGKWILDTEQHENETVSYSASWDHVDLLPGHIVAIADPRKAQVRHGGRLVDCDLDRAYLDFPFKPVVGETYSIMMIKPDGTIVTKPITSFEDDRGDGEFGQAIFSPIAGGTPLPGAMWVIVGSDVSPRLYRVLTVREERANEFKITALFHDPTKYARVEQNVILEPISYTRPNRSLTAPAGLNVVERQYVENNVLKSVLTLSWSNPSDYKVRNYVVYMSHPIRGAGIELGTTEGTSIDLVDAAAGEYTFYVIANGYAGGQSEPSQFVYTVAGPTTIAVPTVSSLVNADAPGTFAFSGTDVRIRWENNFATSNDPLATGAVPTSGLSPFYKSNTVRVFDAATNTLLRQDIVRSTSYTYSYMMNVADNAAYSRGPSRAVKFVVSVTDIYDRTSSPVEISLTNPPPGAVTAQATAIGNVVFVNWDQSADFDVAGYVLHVSEVENFIPSPANRAYNGSGNSISLTLASNKTYFLKAAAYDRFGEQGITYSAEITATTGVFVDTAAPAKPNPATVTSEVRTDGNGSEYTVLIVNWAASPEPDFAYYDLQLKEGTGNFVSFQTSSTTFEIRARGGAEYVAKVRAVDAFGNASFYSDPSTPHTALLAAGGNPVDVINAGTTQIDPGKILISGGTSLADWRSGGDQTKIDGGNLAANTVKANAVEIGMRNISLDGIQFEFNSPSANSVSWTAGQISYVNDAGVPTTATIAANNAAWTAGILYVYWVKGESVLRATSVAATAFTTNNIVLASYRGDKDLNSTYGRTIIDGGSIKTGTIQAAQIAAGSISADKMAVATLSAIAANIGTVTSGMLQSSDGKMQVDLTNRRILIQD